MPDDVKLKSILSEKESLNSIYDTSARIISRNAFGETVTKSPEAIFSPTGNFNGLFVGIGFAEVKDERDLNSTLSTGVFFSGVVVYATGVPDAESGCGSLVFNQPCTSAHLITIGL